MKNLKMYALVVTLLVTSNGFSWVKICGNHTNPNTGHTQVHCYAGAGKCDDELLLVNATWFYPGGWTCIDGIAASNDEVFQLVKEIDGSAVAVVNGEQTPIISDAFIVFMKRMQKETAKRRVNTQTIQRMFDEFLSSDNGVVSDARLQQLSSEMRVPIEKRAKKIMAMKNIRRDGVLMSDTMQRTIFNPTNSRRMSSLSINSLDRDLTKADRIFFVEPKSYAILNTDNTNGWGIGYFWEVVSTDQGILMAIPIPNVESYGKRPIVCECDSKHYGTCLRGFCFYNIEPDKCTMKPMKEEDPKLCITMRNVDDDAGGIDFIDTFWAETGGQTVRVVMRGNISSNPITRNVWASTYVPGVGCFLESPMEIPVQYRRQTAFSIQNILNANGITGSFEHGIKEKGIK